MNPQKFQELFPLGSHLCREPMPETRQLKPDMEDLKRHGFNLVKLREHWMIDEPEHPERLLLPRRVCGNKQAWLFTNPTSEDVTEIIDVAGWSHVEDLLGGKLERVGDRIELTVKGLDVRVLVLETAR